MKDEVYEKIINIINTTKGSKIIPNRECFKVLKEVFPEISDYTIGSIYSLEYTRKMRQNHFVLSNIADQLHKRFNAAVEEGQPEGILLRMSDEIDLSPALLARLIVVERYQEKITAMQEAEIKRKNETNLTEEQTLTELEENVTGIEILPTTIKDSKELIESQATVTNISGGRIINGKTLRRLSVISAVDKMHDEKLMEHETSIQETAQSNINHKKLIASESLMAKISLNEVKNEKEMVSKDSKKISAVVEVTNDVSSDDEDGLNNIITVTGMMRDPTLIEDPRLGAEAFLCTLHDDQYGPIADCIKHSIGQEYEMLLVRMARAAGLIFRSEVKLRKAGFDKTPDVMLEVPAVVDGFIINWIESKALFGDEETHNGYKKDQYQCYWNRFGPGMVIYWFGFIDRISDRDQGQFLIAEEFPKNIALAIFDHEAKRPHKS